MHISSEVNGSKLGSRSESNTRVLLKVARRLKGRGVTGLRPETCRSKPGQAEAVRKYGGGLKQW